MYSNWPTGLSLCHKYLSSSSNEGLSNSFSRAESGAQHVPVTICGMGMPIIYNYRSCCGGTALYTYLHFTSHTARALVTVRLLLVKAENKPATLESILPLFGKASVNISVLFENILIHNRLQQDFT